MSGVDNRVVQMGFNNGAFETGVSKTMGTLDKLKKSLDFSGSKKGLDELQNTGSKFNMGGMGAHIEGLSGKLLAMGTVGVTALANITNKAVNAGITLIKSLTIDPVSDGLREYEEQLGSIQTIMANTGLTGDRGLGQVNDALNVLNKYSDQTIYNFGQMAKNIGTFTAAGVKLKPATQAIKGIANLAALSGSTADQASTAMYQLSQAISNNKVGLQDWNSVVNAGMGGKVFQEALFNTAKQLGTIKDVDVNTSFDEWTKAGNSFRDSLKQGWITGNVLTQTLSQFTGDLTDAQLKALGYSDAQIKSIQQQAKIAQDAATKVKTVHQLLDTLKEAVGSGWSQTFATIFGNFNEARDLWTSVNNVLGGLINTSANARNKMLKDWKALGGRTALIDTIKLAFQALAAVVNPIKEAFRDIFPAMTGKQLADLTFRLHAFVENLKISDDTAALLKRTFKGVFALLDIGKQVITGLFHVVGHLVGVLSGGSGGVLEFSANIGDFLVKLDNTIKKGGKLTDFFDGLGRALEVPLTFLSSVRDAIFGLFDGFDQKDISGITDSLGNLGSKLSGLSSVTRRIGGFFSSMWQKAQPAITQIQNGFHAIMDSLAQSFNGANFDHILKVIQTGLLGGIVLLIKKFLSNGINVDLGGGVLGSIKDSFETLTGSMKAMQTQIKAKTLLLIAGAIALLTASVVALSLIDGKRLETALKAMAVSFGELLGSMAILTKISGSAGFVKVPLIAASMVLLAGAVLLLTVAVRNLSSLSWQELSKGLTGVAALLAAISVASKVLSANSGGMVRAGVGIAAIAVAMNILYFAVKNFSSLSWGELIKGLTAVAGSLAAIAAGMKIMPKGMAAQGLGILEISIALNALYLAVKNFGTLNWKVMAKGLIGVAGSLTAIAVGMKLMPTGMIGQAAALVIISGALLILGSAIGKMGAMSFKVIGKGLGTLAVALGILAGALFLMEAALPGAAALLVAAGAVAILTPALKALGKMSIGDIVKGLAALAGAFLILGLGALALSPVGPALLAVGLAVLALGAGIGLATAGIGAMAAGFAALAGVGTAGVAVLLKTFQGFIMMIPEAAKSLAEGLVEVAVIVGKNAPTIVGAFGKIVEQLIQLIITKAPGIGQAFEVLIGTALKVVRDKAPDIIATGFELLTDLLQGISDNIGKVTNQVADIVVKFLNALAGRAGQLVAAGLNVLVKLLSGISNNIGKVISAAGSIVVNLISGVSGQIGRIIRAGTDMALAFLDGIANATGRLVAGGLKMIVKILNGIADGIEKYEPQIIEASGRIAVALVDGLWNGIVKLKDKFMKKLKGWLEDIWDSIKGFFDIFSPSKKMHWIGEMLVKGMTNGVGDNGHHAKAAMLNVGQGMVNGLNKSLAGAPSAVDKMTNNLNKSLSTVPDSLSIMTNLSPKITPVLDLSNIQKDATQINGLLTPSAIAPTVSFAQASAISADRQQAADSSTTDATAAGGGTIFKFEQTNTSPKSLSESEIYRNTNNLLAQAKSALGL
jgi:tape measure domain-containing protein